jgi:hypothetical protein
VRNAVGTVCQTVRRGKGVIDACHPQDYLLTLYSMSPEVVVLKLNEMARKRDKELIDLVLLFGKALPNFSSHLIEDLALEF